VNVTVASALSAAMRGGLDRLDAQLLMGHVLGQTRSWLIAHDDDVLPPAQQAQFDALVQRRVDGEPVAYLLGEKEFYGLCLKVSPAVLVPRPDTETLVDWALELLRERQPHDASPQVVDLGCGSGAIALALKRHAPFAQVTAVEHSADALAVARDNAQRLQLDIDFQPGDWWQATPGRRFQLAVSNPPYIAAGDAHLPALRHEPLSALTPGDADGLSDLRRIVAQAPEHLDAGAWLLLEHGHDQADAVAQMLHARFVSVATRTDLAGRPRCTGGCLR
jgi:release factor glutamine methyltransferase